MKKILFAFQISAFILLLAACDNEDGKIVEFAEKPKEPKSNLASMGVYVFTWDVLKKYLQSDEKDSASSNDFGKNIIPTMLESGENMCAYAFDGYWKDVGTVQSLWEANMDILQEPPAFELNDSDWKIYSRNPVKPPHYIAKGAKVNNCCVTEGCNVYGDIKHSILFEGVTVEKGAVVEDSIVFPGAVIKENAVVKKAVVGEEAVIGKGAVIGDENSDSSQFASTYCTGGISIIGGGITIADGEKIGIKSDLIILEDETHTSGHARNGIFIEDPKYNINGYYYFDATWDSKRKDNDNSYLLSYKYFAKTKEQMDALLCAIEAIREEQKS